MYRLRPLGPHACYTVDFKLLPLAVGCLHIDAVRVTDLLTQQVTDIRHLPTVTCKDK